MVKGSLFHTAERFRGKIRSSDQFSLRNMGCRGRWRNTQMVDGVKQMGSSGK